MWNDVLWGYGMEIGVGEHALRSAYDFYTQALFCNKTQTLCSAFLS